MNPRNLCTLNGGVETYKPKTEVEPNNQLETVNAADTATPPRFTARAQKGIFHSLTWKGSWAAVRNGSSVAKGGVCRHYSKAVQKYPVVAGRRLSVTYTLNLEQKLNIFVPKLGNV